MKLKKKQRPMTWKEWVESTGGHAAVYEAFDGDEERMRKAAEELPEPTPEWAEAQRIGAEGLEKYHEYVCNHIAYLLEKKR